MKRHSSIMAIIGLILLTFSLVLMFEPYYTYAQIVNDSHPCRIKVTPDEKLFEWKNMNPGDSRTKTVTIEKIGPATASLYFSWDLIYSKPALDEDYNLFKQMRLLIRSGNRILYNGPMSSMLEIVNGKLQPKIFKIVDEIHYRDIIKLDFVVSLPGPSTGNEYQGATAIAELIFFTTCTSWDPENPTVSPPVDPEGEEDVASLVVFAEDPLIEPPLPRTDGVSLFLFFLGLLLLLAGLILRKSAQLTE